MANERLRAASIARDTAFSFLPSFVGVGIGAYLTNMLAVPEESKVLFWILIVVMLVALAIGYVVLNNSMDKSLSGMEPSDRRKKASGYRRTLRSAAIACVGLAMLLVPLAIVAVTKGIDNAYLFFVALTAAVVIGSCAAQLSAEMRRTIEEEEVATASEALSAHERLADAIGEVNRVITSTQHASTATCIPMRYDKVGQRIRAVMIYNPAYTSERWMFPGGHTLPSANDIHRGSEPPCDTAIGKMREEVGFDGRIVDLFGAYEVTSRGPTGNMVPFQQPHFTYIFSLDSKANCYKLHNHRYHFDSVYVVEYSQVDEEGIETPDGQTPRGGPGAPYEAVIVDLPLHKMTADSVRTGIENSLTGYSERHSRPSEYTEFGEYAVTMLLDAHEGYLNYLRRSGQLKGTRRGRRK